MSGRWHIRRTSSEVAVKNTSILLCVVALFSGASPRPHQAQRASTPRFSRSLLLSRADYLDRVPAIWEAHRIGQITGVRFEHQPDSTLPVTPLTDLRGDAPVDDDYYYEMVAIRAFEKYGIGLTWNNSANRGSTTMPGLCRDEKPRPHCETWPPKNLT
jgi:hypothetical protein